MPGSVLLSLSTPVLGLLAPPSISALSVAVPGLSAPLSISAVFACALVICLYFFIFLL